MWDAIRGLLASKKAMMAVLSVVIWLVGRLGLELSAEELGPAVAPLWLYIFGQGIADAGKGRIEAEAKARALPMWSPSTDEPPTGPPR